MLHDTWPLYPSGHPLKTQQRYKFYPDNPTFFAIFFHPLFSRYILSSFYRHHPHITIHIATRHNHQHLDYNSHTTNGAGKAVSQIKEVLSFEFEKELLYLHELRSRSGRATIN